MLSASTAKGLRPLSVLLLIFSVADTKPDWVKQAPPDTYHLDRESCSQVGIECSVVEDEACDLASTWQSSGAVPGTPRDLALQTHLLPGEEGKSSWSRVDISWSMPEEGSFKSLLGFEVRIISQKWPNQQMCFVYNLARVGWTSTDASRTFFLDDVALRGMEPHGQPYTIQVRSLPISDVPYANPQAFLTVSYKPWDRGSGFTNDPENAASWTTDLVVYNDSCNSTVTTAFSFAPKEYHFKEYNVELIDSKTDRRVHQEVVKDDGTLEYPIVQFPVVSKNGTFYIKMHVSNTGAGTDSCVCKCADMCVSTCPAYGCIETRSGNFRMTVVPKSQCVIPIQVEPPTGLSMGQWIGVAVGITTGVTIAVLAVVCLVRRSRRPSYKLEGEGTGKRVFIWSSDEPMKDLLAAFLRNRGHFYVTTGFSNNDTVFSATDKAAWLSKKKKVPTATLR